MFVSGLTVLRNAVKLGYPFEESIRSALPLCDEYIAVVGESDDGTLDAVKAIGDPKIRIVESTWSDKIDPPRYVLSQQTNIGLHLCRGDWVVYLQANELLHEKAYDNHRSMMDKYADDRSVEALLLERLTFWGDFGHYLKVYPHRFKYSPRIVKPYAGMYSIRDGMSFGVFDGFSLKGRYPRALDTGEDVYRYGYVAEQKDLADKDRSAVHMSDNIGREFGDDYFYTEMPRPYVAAFPGTHPSAMSGRQEGFTNAVSLDSPKWRTDLKVKERQRVFETSCYEKFGVPSFRNTRYRLSGGYVRKERG